MKLNILLVIIAATLPIQGIAFAEKGTFVDKVQFIQYLDENTALEEVKNGNLDIYYYRISSDRIDSSKAREGLKVFDSTGGSYSLLVNPAKSENFNPFSIQEVRFALNYLVDRNLIVNELMGGYGVTMSSNYGPYDPDYLYIVEELESYDFRYNPALADDLISSALTKAGAQKVDNVWTFDGKEIEIIAFIRSDDPVRKSIGEIISSELEQIGFKVKKEFGDLNKAFVVVYGPDPADLKWHFYTEGWGGRSAFVKYDPVGLAQMYSPWFSSMPGFNDPTYWNYQNDYLDSLTQKIYTGNFSSSEERIDLFREATREAVKESVRIFLASKIDQYAINEKIDGVINDFGAGVPSRFTPINARTDSDSLIIGVKQIYQGSWNPVMGISDVYSRHIWDTVSDPGVFKHPYTGETIPVRTLWEVETAGPDNKLDVPNDAIIWDIKSQNWKTVESAKSTSKVTFDLLFGNWHHGIPMDMNDILHSIYFTLEWGSEQKEDDKTFDTEYSPRALQSVKTMIAIRPIDHDTIEVYVDYWHFDEAEIADWANTWTTTPWELMVAMEQAVIDGKVAFSRSGSVSKGVNWLSLIVPHDANIILQYLQDNKNAKYVPTSLQGFGLTEQYIQTRYGASINWIEENNHAIISNGPFYLDRYSPESRTITTKAFADPTYPFEQGRWKIFEEIKFPKIVGIDMPEIVTRGAPSSIKITTTDSSKIHYFLKNSQGEMVDSGIKEVDGNTAEISISEEKTSKLGLGANDLKLFAISEEVLRPDIYRTSFFSVDDSETFPEITIAESEEMEEPIEYFSWISIGLGIVIVGVILYFRRFRRKKLMQTS